MAKVFEKQAQAVIKKAGALYGMDLNPKYTETYTLKLLKDSLKGYTTHLYYRSWKLQGLQVTAQQINAMIIDDVRYGKVELYKYNTFRNTINKCTDKLVTEVVSDMKIEINEEPVESFEHIGAGWIMIFPTETFADIFKTGFIYEKVGVAIDLRAGYMEFTVLEPYRYRYSRDRKSVVIMFFGDDGVELETRTLTELGTLVVDGVETTQKGLMFFEFTFASDMRNYLETILAFDMVDSNADKEGELNKSKMFANKKAIGGNVINTEIIHMLDTGKNIDVTKGDKVTDYMKFERGVNSLPDLLDTKRDRAMDLTNVFGLSKKALGLESAPQDYASSIPYENDTTAKSVNRWRKVLGQQLSQMLTVVTGVPVKVDLGKYSLESEESNVKINKEAIQSKQRSIIEAVSANKGLSVNDPEVLLETAIIKYENSLPLLWVENEALVKAGLLGTDDFEEEPTKEV